VTVKNEWLPIVFSALWLLSANTLQADVRQPPVLRINPFLQPGLTATPVEQERSAGVQTHTADLVLRGTLMAGSDPMANIGGVILEIGGEVNGYRLVSVGERKVIVEKDGVRKTLTIDNE
jgi:hypothetical protein